MTELYIRLRWNDMPSDGDGMGVYDEDYSLLYRVCLPDGNVNVYDYILRLADQYFKEDPDADRLAVDDYIIEHLKDDYGITMCMVPAETLEIE